MCDYSKRVVFFIDILGFQDIIKENKKTPEEICEILKLIKEV